MGKRHKDRIEPHQRACRDRRHEAVIPDRIQEATLSRPCRWIAGLWEIWRDPAVPDAEPLRTCTIITGAPNNLVATIHDRMPVIVPREKYSTWLSAKTSPEERASMLTPYPTEQMRAYPISRRVNSPGNDDAELIEPLD